MSANAIVLLSMTYEFFCVLSDPNTLPVETHYCLHLNHYNSHYNLLFKDDVSEVGEEDSFLGQTSSAALQPSTFNYFSSNTTSSDPFASIGQQPCPPPAPTAVPSTTGPSPASVPAGLPINPPISQMNPAQQYGSVINQTSMGTYTPPRSTPTPPPPQSTQQSYNPYRHTAASSKANPYIMAPELQQQPPSHTSQHLNPYSQATPAPSFQTPPAVFSRVGFILLFL